MSIIFDIKSPSNQKKLDNLRKCKAIAKTFEEWVQIVQNETIKQVDLLSNTRKDTSTIVKKVELNIERYEKEKGNWVKEVLWIDKV